MFVSVVAWKEKRPEPSFASGLPLPIVCPRWATETTVTGSDDVNITSPSGTVAKCLGCGLCLAPGSLTMAGAVAGAKPTR